VHRRIALAPDTSHALDQLAHETGRSVHDLADEAICDLLKKYRRPRSLLEALRESTRQHPANDPHPPRVRRRSR
jgi:predicted transcriptional regulator